MNSKTRVIASLATVTTAALVLAPVGSKASVKKVTLLANQNKTQEESTVQNKVKSTIHVNNVWSQALFTLNIENNVINVTKGWSEVDPYSSGNLTITIENSSRNIKKTVSFKGGNYPEDQAYKEFNDYKLQIGDIIKISSNTGSIYNIDGSSQTGTVLYKVTDKGLSEITQKAESVQALYNGSNIEFSCKVAANEGVILNCNGQTYNEMANSNGEVNATINGNIGDTITITPQDGLTSTVKVIPDKNDFKLQQQNVQVNNVWNQNLVNISFNYNNTFKVQCQWGETNPYYTGNDSFNIQLINTQGTIIKSETFKGGIQIGNAIAKAFNGMRFNYGDLIHIKSNSGASAVVDGKTYKNDIYFNITKDGLQEITANNTSYKAEYLGNATLVTGTTKANTTIKIYENGKEYTTTSDNNGNFSLKIPVTSVGSSINIINEKGISQPVVVSFNKNLFKIVNSKIEVINNWGSDAVNLTFNPENMEMQTNGMNQFLGSSNNSNFIGMYLYNSKGELQAGNLFNGNQSTVSFSKEFNGQKFSFGDILEVCFNKANGSVKVLNGDNDIADSNGTIKYYEVTKDGLVPYEAKTQINPLNIITSNPIMTFSVSGKGSANSSVNVNYNGKDFTGVTNENGDFSINVSSNQALTSRMPITIKINGDLPQTVYASASNMLQSNSGVYIAGNGSYFGKITFNPITMKMEWFNLGSTVNPVDNNPSTYTPTVKPANLSTIIDSKDSSKAFSFTLKNKEGKIIESGSVNGSGTIGDIYNIVNNKSFEYGDTVTIYQNHGEIGINVISNGKIITPNIDNISFEITPNGLVDAVKGQTPYSSSFKVTDYYAGNGIVSTGLTASGWDSGSEGLANSMVMNQAMKDRVNQAIKGCTNDIQKAKAIFEIVSPVPYKNVGGNTINTYNNGGVCFNKAKLYAVMCQYAGIVSRLVTGYANEPGNYQRYAGYHSWNQVWIPSQDRWMTVDTTWHIFNCNEYVNTTRHSFSVQATLWNPKQSYTSYFKNDPAMAWYHTGEVWNHADYYNFNLGNNPQFQNLFKGIYPSEIETTNHWGTSAATIGLNGTNNTFTINSSKTFFGNSSSNPFMTISLINPKDGSIVFSDTVKNDDYVSTLANMMKNQHYKIGDLLSINYDTSNGTVKVFNNKKNVTDTNGLYQIAETGIVPYEYTGTSTAVVKATTGLNDEAIYSASVNGTTTANQNVYIYVNGEQFKTTSNKNGEFNCNIKTKSAITDNTQIKIEAFDAKTLVVKPQIAHKLELQDSSIVINDVWNYSIGTLGFNENKVLKVAKGWIGTNPYLSNKDEAFALVIKNKDGQVLKTLKAMGNTNVQNTIYSEFDNLQLQNGDTITIDYVKSSNISIKNVLVDGKLVKDYKVTKPTTVTVEEGGFVLGAVKNISKEQNGVKPVSATHAVIENSNNKNIVDKENVKITNTTITKVTNNKDSKITATPQNNNSNITTIKITNQNRAQVMNWLHKFLGWTF